MKTGFELINSSVFVNNEYVYEYRHRNGLKLVHIKGDDPNYVFSGIVNTESNNDSGVAHIVEHVILCGSKKYGELDVFEYLNKSTLNRYLNAITYQGKTVYAVSSYEKNEFVKLTKVYLDCLFAPNNTVADFEREKKIVYNEMTSTYQDKSYCASQFVIPKISKKYKYNSHGIPNDILDVTYDEFVEYYNSYYTYDNITLYFYGDYDIQQYMQLVEEYMYIEKNKVEKKHNEKCKCLENTTNNSYIVYDIGTNNSYDSIVGEYTFRYIFDEKLNEFLIKNNVCDTVDVIVNKDTSCTFGIIVLYDVSEKCEDVKEVVRTYLEQVKGYQKNTIANKMKFDILLEDYGYKPKGLQYMIYMSDYALNKEVCNYNDVVNKIKNNKQDDAQLINQFKLKYEPKYVLGCKNNVDVNKIVENEIAYNEICVERENVKKVIHRDFEIINLEDVEINDIVIKFERIDKKNFYYIDKSDIIFINIKYLVEGCNSKNLNKLGVVCLQLFKNKTANLSQEEVVSMVNEFVGRYSFDVETLDGKVYISFDFMILREYVEEAVYIIFEVLQNSVFETLQKNIKMYEIYDEYNDNKVKYVINNNIDNNVYNIINNIKGVEFIKSLNNCTEIGDVQSVYNNIFCGGVISVCLEKGHTDIVNGNINKNLIKSLNKNHCIKNIDNIHKKTENYAIVTKYGESSVICTYYKEPISYVDDILASIITHEYLIPVLRDKYGVYNACCTIVEGNINLFSEKDNNWDKSVEVFDKLNNFLDSVQITDDILKQHKINAIKNNVKIFNKYKLYKEKINIKFGEKIDNLSSLIYNINSVDAEYVNRIIKNIKFNKKIICVSTSENKISDVEKIFDKIYYFTQ